MKKLFQRVSSVFLAMLMVLTAFAAPQLTANAADNSQYQIDTTKTDSTLTVYKASASRMSLSQAVADYNEANGTFLTEATAVSDSGFLATYYLKTVTESGVDVIYAYKYLAGAEYTIYQIATITQVPTSTSADQTTYATQYELTAEAAAVLNAVTGGTSYSQGYLITSDNYSTILSLLNQATDTQLATITDQMVSGLTTSDGKASFTNVPIALYYVKETTLPDNVTKSNNFIVSVPITDINSNGEYYWNYDVVAYPKNDDSTRVDKSVTGTTADDIVYSSGDGYVSYGGTALTYTVNVTLPSDFSIYDYTKLEIVDTSSSNVTINSTTNGIASGYSVDDYELKVILTHSDGSTATLTSASDFTYSYTNNVLTITFTTNGVDANGKTQYVADFQDGDVVSIVYNAVVDVDTTDPVTNSATFDNGTITNGSDLPGDDVTISIGGVGIRKIKDDSASTMLEGAKFVIGYWVETAADGTETIVSESAKTAAATYYYVTYDSTNQKYGRSTDIDDAYVVTTTSNSDYSSSSVTQTPVTNALAIFKSMGYGTYYLTEVEAPDGYALMATSLEIVVNADTTKEIIVDNVTDEGEPTESHYYGAGFTYTVTNALSTELPTTGGAGIYMFLIVGAAIMTVAVILLVKNRKQNKAV